MFYKELNSIPIFSEITNLEFYKPIPEDWYVVISDVVNSTQAIENGHYRDVNILGAAPIMAVLRELSIDDIPFVFGGDGVSLCIPESKLDLIKKVFSNTILLAKTDYNIELRAGIISVKELYKAGETLLVGKLKISEIYQQAVFFGGGLTTAEKWLKSGNPNVINLSAESHESVSYEGLECRWQPIKSSMDHTISMLIKPTSSNIEEQLKVYNEFIQFFEGLFIQPDNHPIHEKNMLMFGRFKELLSETRIRTQGLSIWGKVKYLFEIRLRMIIGLVMMNRGIATSSTAWGEYKSDVIANSDFRKFDEMIRLVVSCTKSQLVSVESWLQEKFLEKKLVYGIHVSDAALITCMVFQYNRNHIHFVDGNNGGYASAAIELKKRSKQLIDENP